MVFLKDDFYNNFSAGSKAKDHKLVDDLLTDQIAHLVGTKLPEVTALLIKCGVKPSGSDMVAVISDLMDNLGTNDQLKQGIALMIAKENGLPVKKMVSKKAFDAQGVGDLVGNLAGLGAAIGGMVQRKKAAKAEAKDMAAAKKEIAAKANTKAAPAASTAAIKPPTAKKKDNTMLYVGLGIVAVVVVVGVIVVVVKSNSGNVAVASSAPALAAK